MHGVEDIETMHPIQWFTLLEGGYIRGYNSQLALQPATVTAQPRSSTTSFKWI